MVAHWQIRNTKCQSCGNTTLRISNMEGTEVNCAVCHTKYAVAEFKSGKFGLVKLEK